MHSIQKLFEDAGYDLEEDNTAAELCDHITKIIRACNNGKPYPIREIPDNKRCWNCRAIITKRELKIGGCRECQAPIEG